MFDTVTLRPSQPGWWRSTQFDPQAGQLVLKNFSWRHLITSAYPSARITSDVGIIDRAHYDIEARWHGQGEMSERHAYRELLKRVIETNSNLQIYLK